MKNARAIGMLAVSIGLGLAVVVIAASQVNRAGAASHKVVVAAADLDLGSKLSPQMVALVDWPQGSTPTGAFSDVNTLQERVLRTSVQRGEPILNSKLAPVGSAGGLSAVIADGKRAMTVRVNDVVGVAGFALPGNYVDILVNARPEGPPGSQSKPITKTVLEHVLVLAVAQEASRDDTKPKVVNAVTLELSPADAEKIDLARNVGTLSLVLRNQIDQASVKTAGINAHQLFDLADTPSAPPPRVGLKTPTRARAVAIASVAKDCVEVIQDGARKLACF